MRLEHFGIRIKTTIFTDKVAIPEKLSLQGELFLQLCALGISETIGDRKWVIWEINYLFYRHRLIAKLLTKK